MAAPTSQTFANYINCLFMDRISCSLYKPFYCFRIPSSCKMDTMNTLGQGLLNHPCPGKKRGLVQTQNGQRYDDSWSSMSTWCGTAIY